jgi:Mrp family chromosome partitioning ATPase
MTMLTLARDSMPAKPGLGGGIVAEQYHALVHWIRSSGGANATEAKTIGVTGCTPGAGVSTVAANLAVAAAQGCDRPVLLLDLSSARPLLGTRLAMSGDFGLRRALSGDSHPGQSVTASPIPNLSLLAIGEAGSLKPRNTDGRQVNDLLRDLERDFCFIVVDLPPVDSGLCFAISGALDGVLLVIEAQRTHGESAARAKQRLIHANAAVLGVILNS